MAGFLVPCRSLMIQRQGTLDTLLPERHLARFIWQVLCDLDFSAVEAGYRSVPGQRGRPPYHPRVLVALWIYGMTQGLETASAIVEACRLRDDFRWLAGGLCPSDQTLLNLLGKGEELASIWVRVLQAMHRQGHIDLSVILEDGTKLRANASPRSFCTAEEIEQIMGKLRARLEKLQQPSETAEADAKSQAKVRGLQGRLARAERAVEELRERAAGPSQDQALRDGALASPQGGASDPAIRAFGREDFVRQEEPDVLICPAAETLRFIGRYPTDNGRGTYRLYGRRDCTGCTLKERCTKGRGRRIRIPELRDEASSTQEPSCVTSVAGSGGAASAPGSAVGQEKQGPRAPQASLTDPEARFMLATSEKRHRAGL